MRIPESTGPPPRIDSLASYWPVVSLFSGAGGLDWGFHQLGFPIAHAVDSMQAACITYESNLGLRPAHARRCHHVHGLGDLFGLFDRNDFFLNIF